MKLYIQIIILLVTFKVFGCDCPQIDAKTYLKKAIENSHIVFHGELIQFDSIKRTYKFKVIECFKGKYNSIIIDGYSENTSCSRFPRNKGLWLIFSKLDKNNKICLDGCNPSYAYGYKNSMVPYFKFGPIIGLNKKRFSKIDSLKCEIDLLNQKIDAITQWNLDLERLRQYKKENFVKPNTTNSSFESKTIWLFVLSLCVFVLFLKIKQ